MNKNRFIELLTKHEAGEITLPEQKEFKSIVENEDRFSEILSLLQVLSTGQSRFDQLSASCLEDKWVAQQKKLNSNEQFSHITESIGKRIWRLRKHAIAASILIFAAIAFLYYHSTLENRKSASQQNIATTKTGSQTTLLLPDGSQVWLNADTKLSYDKQFGNNTRDVFLSGEAYFDVKHDSKHPFIVHTHTIDVRVWGTAFDVRAYENEKSSQTTLFKGSVEVTFNKMEGKKIMLKPYEKIIIKNNYPSEYNIGQNIPSSDNDMPDIAITTIKKSSSDSAIKEPQWTKNMLVFDHEKLEDIALTLQRWYETKIIIEDEDIKAKVFCGSFENKSISEIINALQLSGGFNYKLRNDSIIISK